jgi:hypothetical protein
MFEIKQDEEWKLLYVEGRVSVSSWENEIQTLLATHTVSRGDNVLEIGYGLGLANKTIAEIIPCLHMLIEKEVGLVGIDRCDVLINSKWQDIAPFLCSGLFDSIVFDADFEESREYVGSLRDSIEYIFPFLPFSKRLLKNGGKIGFLDFSCELFDAVEFNELLKELSMRALKFSASIPKKVKSKYANETCDIIVVIKL